jgi:hypothetical protein
VEGVSSACATAFGAAEAATSHGFELLNGNEVPGTSGLPSLGGLVADGYTVLIFRENGRTFIRMPARASEEICKSGTLNISVKGRSKNGPGKPRKRRGTGP